MNKYEHLVGKLCRCTNPYHSYGYLVGTKHITYEIGFADEDVMLVISAEFPKGINKIGWNTEEWVTVLFYDKLYVVAGALLVPVNIEPK